MSEDCRVTCSQLEFGYSKPLSEPLDWCVRPGEFWAVVGSNGCGKSTLIKTLLGFIKPISGTFNRASNCAYVSQLSDDVSSMPARVRDVIGIGLENRSSWFVPFYRFRHRGAIHDAVQSFELEYLLNRQFCKLSPGERQRVLMAQAMVSRPDLVFLDEPSSAMDSAHARAAYRKLGQIGAEANIAVVAITHHLNIARDVATHVMRFEHDCISQSAIGDGEHGGNG